MSKTRVFNENAALRGAWRRVFARSPLVVEILNEGKRKVPKYNKDGSRSKRDGVQYHCQVCDTWVPARFNKRNNIAVDHIKPVIDEKTGFVDWNTFHDRLFCNKRNLQRICRKCHDKKTHAERMKRNTVKYNVELDAFELEVKHGKITDIKDIKKFIRKYKTNTRPESIRRRATKLLETLPLLQKDVKKCKKRKRLKRKKK